MTPNANKNEEEKIFSFDKKMKKKQVVRTNDLNKTINWSREIQKKNYIFCTEFDNYTPKASVK